MKFKFNYLSDLHLEFSTLAKTLRILKHIVPSQGSDTCVLAGDIAYPFQENYAAFLRGMSQKFKHIFLIHGNHEYYQLKENSTKTMSDIVKKTEHIECTFS